MKRFSLSTLLIVFTVIAFFIATIAYFLRERDALVRSLDHERKVASKLQNEIGVLQMRLVDANEEKSSTHFADNGAKMLLVRLLTDEAYSSSAEFLREIDSDALFTKTIKFPSSSNTALFRFADPQLNNTVQGTTQKKMYVIATLRPLEIIDVISGEVKIDRPETDADPWNLEYDLPDGTEFRYRVLPTGFERMQNDSY